MRKNNPKKAAVWHIYFEKQQARLEAIKYYYINIISLTNETLMEIIENRDLPNDARFQAYILLFHRAIYGGLDKIILGPPEDLAEYLLADKFESPEMKILQLSVAPQLKGDLYQRITGIIDYIKAPGL